MSKRVSIYKRAGVVYVTASHQTKDGFWIDDSDVITLTAPQPPDIESAVEAALDRSHENVPTPSPSVALSDPLLAAAGVASWNKFMRAAKYVRVGQTGNMIEVTPYKNMGGKGGFGPMQGKSIALPSENSGLGALIAHALEIAE